MADIFDSTPAVPIRDPYGAVPGAGTPSAFSQAIALARQQQAEARLAQQQAAGLDTAAAKQLKYADDLQNFAGADAIRNKVRNLDKFINEKITQREQADGKTMSDVDRAKFRLEQIRQFSSSLAGTKSFENEVVALAQATGDAQAEFKRLEKEQPGFFRNVGGVVGAFGGSVISSVADAAGGILTLAGVDRSNPALKFTGAISKGGQAIGEALGTKEQNRISADFSKALDDGNIEGMFKALGEAPGYLLGQLAGGIVGPGGAVGLSIKTARQLETVAKFSSALARYGQTGNNAQKLLTGAVSNLPLAVGFGVSEAGQAANDAERILLERNPSASEAEINSARQRAAVEAGGITAAGTLLAPGLEGAAGKVVGAFGKKTGDVLARDLEAAVAKKAGLGKKAAGVTYEGTLQGIEEGLVAGAGQTGADYAQGKEYNPTFNPAAAVLGASLGGAGKVAGDIGGGIAERRQGAADTAATNAAAAQEQAKADEVAAAAQQVADATQQATAQGEAAKAQSAAEIINSAQAEGVQLANEIVATPTALAKLRQDVAGGLDPVSKIAESDVYKKALEDFTKKAFPDPAAQPTTEQVTAIKDAFDTQLKQMAQMPAEPAEAGAKKIEALSRVTAEVKALNTLVNAKGDDNQRTDSARLSDSLKNLLDSRQFLSSTEFGAEADRIKTEAQNIKQSLEVADAIRGEPPKPPVAPKAATEVPSAIPEPPKPPKATREQETKADAVKAAAEKTAATLKRLDEKMSGFVLKTTTDASDVSQAQAALNLFKQLGGAEVKTSPQVIEHQLAINAAKARVDKLESVRKAQAKDIAAVDKIIRNAAPLESTLAAAIRAREDAASLDTPSPEVGALDKRIAAFSEQVKKATTGKEPASAPVVASEPPKSEPAQPVSSLPTDELVKRLTTLSPNSKVEATPSQATQPPVSPSSPQQEVQNDAKTETGVPDPLNTPEARAQAVPVPQALTDAVEKAAEVPLPPVPPELKALADGIASSYLGEPPADVNEMSYTASLNPNQVPAFLHTGLSPAAVYAIRRGDTVGVLTELSKNGSTPLVREVSARLLAVGLGAVKIKFAPTSPFGTKTTLGSYRPGDPTVMIHEKNGLREHVVLHELTHAATINAIANPQTELHRAAVGEIIRVYNIAQASPEINKNEYAFTNVAEFVAEFFSNPQFQKQLARVKDTGTPQTLFSRLLHAILRIVGVNSLLGSSFRAGELLLAPPSSLRAYRVPKFDGTYTLKGEPSAARTELALIDSFESGINDRLGTAIRTGDFKGITQATSTSIRELSVKTSLRTALDWIEGKALNLTAMRDIGYLMKGLFTPKEGPNAGVNLMNKVIDQVALRGSAINAAMKRIDDTLVNLYAPGKLNGRVANELMSRATRMQFSPDMGDKNYRKPVTDSEKQLQALWNSLGPNSAERKVYQVSRKLLKDQLNERALVTEQQMIEYGMLPADAKKMGDQVRNSGLDVYFAQDRFGPWVTSVKDASTGEQLWFARHTSRSDAEATRKQLLNSMEYAGHDVANVGLYEQHEKPKFNTSTNDFIRRVTDGLVKKGLTPEQLKEVEQRMIEVYQDSLISNINANQQKRQFIAGADEDMLTANVRVLRNGATAIANLRFQKQIMDSLSDAKGHVTINRNNPDYDTPRAQQALDVFTKAISYSAQDNPLNTAANIINKVGFIHTMFANTSSAVVNSIGGSIMTTAEINARYGASGAAKLPAAVLDASRALFQLRKNNQKGTPGFDGLSGDVRRVFEYAERYNVIGAAETHEIMDITNDSSYIGRKVMKAGGYLMTVSENVTNMGAMLAAYRAAMEAPSTAAEAKKRGVSPESLALEIATEVRYRSNPDNSAANKSYLQRTPGGRVMLQLKSYGFAIANSMYRDIRSIADSQASREEKAYALKHLTGVIGMHAIAAGAAGLPYMVTAPFMAMTGLASLMLGANDDDQDNLPVATRIRNAIYETYGEDFGNYVYYGVLGAGLSKRVTLNELLLRDPFGKPNNEPVDYLKQLAGPTFGAAESYAKLGGAFIDKVGVVGPTEAAKQAISGGGLPAGLANVVKGFSLFTTPPSQRDGTPLLADDDQVTSTEAFMQMLGFRPSRVAEATDRAQAQKGVAADATNQRRVIMESFRSAFHQAGQGMDTQQVIDDANAAVQRYNARFPEKAIGGDDIARVQKKLDTNASKRLVHLPNADAKIVERQLPWTIQ